MKKEYPIGRPLTVHGKRVQVYLNNESIESAKKIGDGNVSRGIRIALKQEEKKND